jgi:hypothetical protein
MTMESAEMLKLKARQEQIKEIMRWVDDAEELAFLELESKQIDRQLKADNAEIKLLFDKGVL